MAKTKKFYCTIILFTIVCGTALFSCEHSDITSISETVQQGIINGVETNYTEWQGAVGLYGVYGTCSAVLIHPRVVLSAAHCVLWDDGATSVDYVNNPQHVIVNGGDHLYDDINYTPVEISAVDEIIVHPDWPGDIYSGYEPDLSLILLSDEAVGIPFYPLHSGPNPPVDSAAVIVGYGLGTAHDNSTGGFHRMGNTNILTFLDNVIEIGGATGTCSGDSGGPLFVEQSGVWKILGIDSYVEGLDYDCPPESESWYVNVVDYRSWIAQTVYDWTGDVLDDIEVDTDTASIDTDTQVDTDTAPAGSGGTNPGGGYLGENEEFNAEPPFGVTSSSGGCSTTPGDSRSVQSSWIIALLSFLLYASS